MGVGMRYPDSLSLDAVVLHSLDNRPATKQLRRSSALLPLDEDPQLTTYLTTHIQRSLNDTAAQAARFRAMDPDTVSGVCEALHGDTIPLVDGSRILAEKLFSIMENDGRIKPGVLAVCFYQAALASATERSLALLKIDLGEMVRTKFIQDAQGNEIVGLEVDHGALATTREGLQKAAFIRALSPRHLDYDMILLDRQVRPESPDAAVAARAVAKFFLETFLQAEPAHDSKERTKRFYHGVITAQNTLRRHGELDSREEEILDRALENALTSARVNIEGWTDNLGLSQTQREVVRDAVMRQQPDMEFEPDQEYVRKVTQKVRFAGSNNLRVTVDAELANQVIVSVTPRREGLREFFEVVLHTDRWDQLPE
jgi:hypothetical protein